VHTYRIETFGCKVSRADAARIERALLGAGLRPAGEEEPAGVCVVCGCTVTGVAEGKSRRALARIARENPGAVVIAAGCIAVRMGERLDNDSAPAAHADIALVPDRIDCLLDELAERDGFAWLREVHAPGEPPGFPRRTRALLKVQDGCDGSCSYCIVPRMRGAPCSRTVADVVEDARRLVGAGHSELVLAGVRLGRFDGGDGSGSLAALVERLVALESEGLIRLRLSSIEPMDFDPALIDLAASTSRLCPHFHLPLQSADDDVLAAMRRPYTMAAYEDVISRIRAALPTVALTTDIIAGFPSESPEAHARSVDYLRRTRFARVHAFPFSARPSTPAAHMAGTVDVTEARHRARQLIEAGDSAARAYRAQFVGSVIEVIAEPGGAPGRLSGYTARYARVEFDGPAELEGKLVRVKASADAPHGFSGELMT
jgi:threonylcarbamoyladenosine tRNA methylthiotransferase MtaB